MKMAIDPIQVNVITKTKVALEEPVTKVKFSSAFSAKEVNIDQDLSLIHI